MGFHLNIPSNRFFKYEYDKYFTVIQCNTAYWGPSRRDVNKKETSNSPLKVPYKAIEILITKPKSNCNYLNYEGIFDLIVFEPNIYNFDISYSIFNVPIDWNILVNKFQLYIINYL